MSWEAAAASLRRPYRLTLPMVVLALPVPFYIFIGEETANRAVPVPTLFLDRALPLQPAWALVYGCVYLFLIVLPIFIVRDEELIRRTLLAYLTVWISAYVVFLLHPTIAPRPVKVIGDGFVVWGLRFLYDSDPPYNCFPSLHVAHSCVSAFAAYRVHRGVGIIAGFGAALVAVSTLFTKQHYVLDVIAGALLASIAYLIFLRGYSRDRVPELDRRAAPALAVGVSGIVAVMFACYFFAYLVT